MIDRESLLNPKMKRLPEHDNIETNHKVKILRKPIPEKIMDEEPEYVFGDPRTYKR